MTAFGIFLPLIATVGASGYLLPLAAARRREPPRLPAWGPWVRATAGWVCVCLGVSMGLLADRRPAPRVIAAACAFVGIGGVMQGLWARDAARRLRQD